MPLEKRLSIILWVVAAVLVILALALFSGGGRLAVAIIVLAALAQAAIILHVGRRYADVLRQAAAELGLEFVGSKKEEEAKQVFKEIKYQTDRDVYRWKIDGRYPFVAGKRNGEMITIRVPFAVDFDTAAPDSTRFSIVKETRLNGFTIFDRNSFKTAPKGRLVATGDPVFDARFYVVGRAPEEVAAVLTGDVRARLLAAGGTGLRGIEVTRYGVFLHENGRVSDVRTVLDRVATVEAVAARLADASSRASSSA